jgi:hypothetical protein
MDAYRFGNYNWQGLSYHYIQQAFALSYIMSHFNMGVSLTRRVNNESFKIIITQEENGTFNITVC